MAAFDLKFSNHELFNLVRNTSLIQQPLRQKVGVSVDEDISTMQAAKQSHDSWQLFVDLVVADLLQPLLHLVVGVESDVVRSLVALVHETLEAHVSCLLELDVVAERFLNQVVHLLLEGQKQFSEAKHVFLVLFV